MKVSVLPSAISGNIKANPSKSAMQRAVAAALLAHGRSEIHNPSPSDDCMAAIEVAKNLGAEICKVDDHFEILGRGVAPINNFINCGEAGLGIRMFTPIAALSDQSISIEAEGSLRKRPIDFFDEILPQLEVECQTNNGKPPLQIKGPLKAKDIEIDGSLSSQFLTGLLMAYGSAAKNVTIRVKNLTSQPYIRLTLDIMRYFGVEVFENRMEEFRFGIRQSYMPRKYTVEGDWSGAAFLLVAAALNGDIELTGLNMESAQSDIAILDGLRSAGAEVELLKHGAKVKKDQLEAFSFDATQCPDLFPPLVALAAGCDGVSRIEGAERLTHKESDRGAALKQEFGKLGVKIEVEGDLMRVYGGADIKGGKVHSHYDHRIAMACAVAATTAKGAIEIEAADAVNKSYPEFWEHWKKIGGKLN